MFCSSSVLSAKRAGLADLTSALRVTSLLARTVSSLRIGLPFVCVVLIRTHSLHIHGSELLEELGLDVDPKSFDFVFHLRVSLKTNGGAFTENEIADVYTWEWNGSRNDLKLQDIEVMDAKWFTRAELKKMMQNNDPSLVFCDVVKMAPLFEFWDRKYGPV